MKGFGSFLSCFGLQPKPQPSGNVLPGNGRPGRHSTDSQRPTGQSPPWFRGALTSSVWLHLATCDRTVSWEWRSSVVQWGYRVHKPSIQTIWPLPATAAVSPLPVFHGPLKLGAHVLHSGTSAGHTNCGTRKACKSLRIPGQIGPIRRQKFLPLI